MQKLLYGVGILFALLVVIGFALPSQSRFVVNAEIDAQPATVFALVNDMHRIDLWSSVSDVDANARILYSGPARGVGATMTWDGIIAGSGTQTIVESRPHEYVEMSINPGEPGEARTWFEMGGNAGVTRINWGFEHDYGMNLVGRYFGLMATGVLRQAHEENILKLKELAESLPNADFSRLEIERLTIEPVDIAYRTTSSAPDAGSMSEALGDSYFEVLTFMDRHGLVLDGSPLSIARTFRGSDLRFDAGIPVRGLNERTPEREGNVRIGRTYAGEVIRVEHRGSYRRLSDTHRKIAAYLAALGIERNGDSWESYVSDPTKVDEAELITWVYYPVK